MGQHNSRRRLYLFLVVCTIALHSSGCLLSYYVKSGYEQLKILNARQPLDKILKDEKVPEAVKEKLRLGSKAQDFAENHLGFTKTKNYTSYVELDRPYVSWIISVAHKDRLEYKMFDYAIVGELPYKGFFNLPDAEKELKKFPIAEYDTMLRGVSAYSTLGWFEDPILSTMISRSKATFIELVLHESAHATIFIKSNADFNEQLASFLGMEAAKIFFLQTEGSESENFKELLRLEADEKLFAAFIKEEIASLEKWYSEKKGRYTEAERLARLETIREKFKKEIDPRLKTPAYDFFPNSNINNAVLLSLGTYLEDLYLFDLLLKKNEGDLKKTIEYLKTLKNEKDPAEVLKSYVSSSDVQTRSAL